MSEVQKAKEVEKVMSKEELEQQAVTLYRHVKEISKMKYESELRREDSLIQQSSQMQTAFSFMTAALFMAAPILIEHRGSLSLNFFFIAFSSIVFFLLLSLVFASLAQRRRKYNAFMDIAEIEKYVSEHWEQTLLESQQLKQWVDLVGRVQKSKADGNDERVTLIRLSMASFFVSIAGIAFWYIVAICKMI